MDCNYFRKAYFHYFHNPCFTCKICTYSMDSRGQYSVV
ncbi:MAG: hypothetical protein LH615_05900 [Ferruginibacter sp.]|nr:hypothetical protein [Ferruginibacter sp.]